MPKLSIIETVSERPTPMQGFLLSRFASVKVKPEAQSPELARWVARRQAIGRIRWPREFGMPQGQLPQAFNIRCYAHAYVRLSVDGTLYTALRLPNLPSEIVVTEGPHDDRFFRVTYEHTVRDPEGWLDSDRDVRALQNYVDADLAVPWLANDATGPGVKLIAPDVLAFVHPRDGAYTLRELQVVHQRA